MREKKSRRKFNVTPTIETAVICPYYKYVNGQTIICEGVGIAKTNAMRFSDNQTRMDWIENNCMAYDFLVCPLARAIEEKHLMPVEQQDGINTKAAGWRKPEDGKETTARNP